MNFPKIVFKAMDIESNIKLVKWAFSQGNGDLSVHDYTIKTFPELSNIDLNSSKEKIDCLISDVVIDYYEKNRKLINNSIDRYNGLWEKYNDVYFKMLSEFLGVEFPYNIKEIEASIGIVPVFPRNVDDFSFCLDPNVRDSKLIETCAHETLHFLWFEKWKKMYPETPRSNFDPPYMEWRYSEMVTDPILNNKPFNELFDFTEKGYDSFYDLYDGDELVMDKLRNIYSTDDSIENKISNGYEYICNYFNSKVK